MGHRLRRLTGHEPGERQRCRLRVIGRWGDAERNISANIVRGLEEAKRRGLTIFGIVGRDGGYTKRVGDAVLVIPTVNAKHVTTHSEAFQTVVLHCLVSHPKLQVHGTTWESSAKALPG